MQLAIESCSLSVPSYPVPPPMMGGMIQKFTVLLPKFMSSETLMNQSCSVMSDCLWSHGLYSPWDSPGQNTGVGSLSLLQGIFQTQGLNPGFRHCRQILSRLSHKGGPRILDWVDWPFCSRSGFLTQESNWAFLQCRRILHQLRYQGSPNSV